MQSEIITITPIRVTLPFQAGEIISFSNDIIFLSAQFDLE